ncbi:MAG: hypothetical protein JNG90_03690 [Planctomycetaceae bacterium]|nr:hypothetical protein [Planctomycetaceae bacterium]
MLSRHTFCRSALVMLALGLPAPASAASILGSQRLSIDFTNLEQAGMKASFSPAGKLHIDRRGLGWEGDANEIVEGWIQTCPLAVGLSWRPATSVRIEAALRPTSEGASGAAAPQNGARLYVRYSPDRQHWSTWQALRPGPNPQGKSPSARGSHFHGDIQVPEREREAYLQLLGAYAERDVPWKSDEEAAAAWIVEHDPEFFARQLPFIGYVEFLLEVSFRGGARVQSFATDVTFGLSGLHVPPRDADVAAERAGPWRFETEQANVDPSGEAALKRVIPLAKCKEISINTQSGWWLKILRDGSARGGYGSSAGDDFDMPAASYDFAQVHRTLGALEYGVGQDASVAFWHERLRTAYGLSTKSHPALVALFEHARQVTKDFAGTRLRELWDQRPPLRNSADAE